MTTTPERFFLGLLFSKLNESGVLYAVMRNYASLPDTSAGSDLDILVHPEDIKRAKAVLFDAIKQSGGIAIGCVQTWTFFEVYALGINNKSEWWGLCVEFYTGVQFKSSVPLVDSNQFDACISKYNDISIVSEHIGNAIGFIKEILAHNEFRADKPQYLGSLLHLYTEHSNQYKSIFSPLGQRGLGLLPNVLENPSKAVRSVAIRKFRRAVLVNAFIKSPGSFLYKRVTHEFHRVKRYFHPSGTVIVILGVDGAGKSTVINAIKPVLDAATHNATFVQHLRPSLLPALARLKGQTKVPSGPVLDPHGSTPSGTLGSLLRLTWLTLDYIFGYWLRTRLIIAKRPAIVIFDRYAYDMALDPRRFRINLPVVLVRGFIRWAPKPDLIICLHGNPAVIAARKNELPLEEVKRQTEALLAFAKQEPNAVLVSTEGTVEQARDDVLMALQDFCERRAKGRLQRGD